MNSRKLTAICSGLMRLSGVLIVVGCATCLVWIVLFLATRSISSLLFFQGCIASLLSFVVICSLLFVGAARKTISIQFAGVIIGLVGLYLGCIMTLFVVLPVSYDRSVSIFLLAHIAASGKEGASTSELESALIERYVIQRKAVDRRIREQLATGTIEDIGRARFALTPRGKELLCINPALERIFRYRNPELANICSVDSQ